MAENHWRETMSMISITDRGALIVMLYGPSVLATPQATIRWVEVVTTAGCARAVGIGGKISPHSTVPLPDRYRQRRVLVATTSLLSDDCQPPTAVSLSRTTARVKSVYLLGAASSYHSSCHSPVGNVYEKHFTAERERHRRTAVDYS